MKFSSDTSPGTTTEVLSSMLSLPVVQPGLIARSCGTLRCRMDLQSCGGPELKGIDSPCHHCGCCFTTRSPPAGPRRSLSAKAAPLRRGSRYSSNELDEREQKQEDHNHEEREMPQRHAVFLTAATIGCALRSPIWIGRREYRLRNNAIRATCRYCGHLVAP